MKTVNVKNITIGKGIPKICISIIGKTKEDILEQAAVIKRAKPDMTELRIDYFEDILDTEKVQWILHKVRETLGELPLLFTIRTVEEGGNCKIDCRIYQELNALAIASGQVDLIDVQAYLGTDIVKNTIEAAHEKQIPVIASYHDFSKTPPKEEIIKRLLDMQKLNADILKMAVMPEHKRDVILLLETTELFTRCHADRPVITMSMGKIGMVSRISGGLSGSAVTFASETMRSALGQMKTEDVKRILNALYEEEAL